MPKPLIFKQNEEVQNRITGLPINVGAENKKAGSADKMEQDRLLRKKRSSQYMDAVKKLDTGGHVQNANQVNELIDNIRSEFPDIEISGILLGFVSVCYLGKPYEVHTLDLTGEIIEHYKVGQPLPNGLEKARGIALYGNYEFIEVYVDCCRAVNAQGVVSVIQG